MKHKLLILAIVLVSIPAFSCALETPRLVTFTETERESKTKQNEDNPTQLNEYEKDRKQIETLINSRDFQGMLALIDEIEKKWKEDIKAYS